MFDISLGYQYLSFIATLYSAAAILLGTRFPSSGYKNLKWPNVAFLISFAATILSACLFIGEIIRINPTVNTIYFINLIIIVASIASVLTNFLVVKCNFVEANIPLIIISFLILLVSIVIQFDEEEGLTLKAFALVYPAGLVTVLLLALFINFVIKKCKKLKHR